MASEAPLSEMETQNEGPEIYDLLILVDATASMSSYLGSLRTSLPKIIAISTLTNCFSRIGLLAYRDYCDSSLIEWSGWFDHNNPNDPEGITSDGLINKAQSLRAMGGGDYPEAAKTGLAKMYQVVRKEATTVALFYTDAPPHASVFSGDQGGNWAAEKRALQNNASYGEAGSNFIDWVMAAKLLRDGEKKVQIFSFLEPGMNKFYSAHYIYMSTMTRGATFYLKNSKPATISQVTVDVVLAWMGAEKSGLDQHAKIPAAMARYKSINGIKKIAHEADEAANGFFAPHGDTQRGLITDNVAEADVTAQLLKQHLPKKDTPVEDFSKRYSKDEGFRAVVVQQLMDIIDNDVSAISLNPVFGSLWRTVCNDRQNPARDGLISTFGLRVDRIADADEKARMKAWLEESYDYTAEVLEKIDSVPDERKYPCVLLDPTLAFTNESKDGDGNEDMDNRPITEFTRDELLEIGRSCDYRILRRLGKVLTRLTFVDSAEELPAHIATTSNEEVTRIPLALADKAYGRQFWRILLHIVVPGTMLGARPGALLAALAIRMGVQPLYEAADQELSLWRERWNDLEIPEIWNTSCLSLLLDADQSARTRGKGGREEENSKSTVGLLKDEDRMLFERLVSYKLVEMNLHTTLTAQVGWTPEKSIMPIGPVVICRSCKFPRSVTIMAERGQCGLCAAEDYASKDDKQTNIARRVSKSDNESTEATWVECGMRTCRAQYVVYNTEQLNVRPKCHYCRLQPSLPAKQRSVDPAPCLECTKCQNRMIWPKEYRSTTSQSETFTCPACSNNRTTIVDVETSASDLNKENGTEWLLRNAENKISQPFNNRTIFYLVSNSGIDSFIEKVELFPGDAAATLKLTGKPIHNTTALKSQLQSWVTGRRTETVPCSLCFTSCRKTALRPACGRSGCKQKICAECLGSWYGLNAPGRIINTAALACPFCRRHPAAKTLASYGMGIHAVGDLKLAVEERGEWIYAWCREGGHAKRFVERVCAGGAPPAVENFTCGECEEAAGKQLAGLNAKECPKCGILTSKTYGCDHLTCRCGAHWCWACGKEFTASEIYDHLNAVHGGLYGGGYGTDGDDLDEDDE